MPNPNTQTSSTGPDPNSTTSLADWCALPGTGNLSAVEAYISNFLHHDITPAHPGSTTGAAGILGIRICVMDFLNTYTPYGMGLSGLMNFQAVGEITNSHGDKYGGIAVSVTQDNVTSGTGYTANIVYAPNNTIQSHWEMAPNTPIISYTFGNSSQSSSQSQSQQSFSGPQQQQQTQNQQTQNQQTQQTFTQPTNSSQQSRNEGQIFVQPEQWSTYNDFLRDFGLNDPDGIGNEPPVWDDSGQYVDEDVWDQAEYELRQYYPEWFGTQVQTKYPLPAEAVQPSVTPLFFPSGPPASQFMHEIAANPNIDGVSLDDGGSIAALHGNNIISDTLLKTFDEIYEDPEALFEAIHPNNQALGDFNLDAAQPDIWGIFQLHYPYMVPNSAGSSNSDPIPTLFRDVLDKFYSARTLETNRTIEALRLLAADDPSSLIELTDKYESTLVLMKDMWKDFWNLHTVREEIISSLKIADWLKLDENGRDVFENNLSPLGWTTYQTDRKAQTTVYMQLLYDYARSIVDIPFQDLGDNFSGVKAGRTNNPAISNDHDIIGAASQQSQKSPWFPHDNFSSQLDYGRHQYESFYDNQSAGIYPVWWNTLPASTYQGMLNFFDQSISDSSDSLGHALAYQLQQLWTEFVFSAALGKSSSDDFNLSGEAINAETTKNPLGGLVGIFGGFPDQEELYLGDQLPNYWGGPHSPLGGGFRNNAISQIAFPGSDGWMLPFEGDNPLVDWSGTSIQNENIDSINDKLMVDAIVSIVTSETETSINLGEFGSWLDSYGASSGRLLNFSTHWGSGGGRLIMNAIFHGFASSGLVSLDSWWSVSPSLQSATSDVSSVLDVKDEVNSYQDNQEMTGDMYGEMAEENQQHSEMENNADELAVEEGLNEIENAMASFEDFVMNNQEWMESMGAIIGGDTGIPAEGYTDQMMGIAMDSFANEFSSQGFSADAVASAVTSLENSYSTGQMNSLTDSMGSQLTSFAMTSVNNFSSTGFAQHAQSAGWTASSFQSFNNANNMQSMNMNNFSNNMFGP